MSTPSTETRWRRTLRRGIVAAATGILTVGVAWAGAGVAPVGDVVADLVGPATGVTANGGTVTGEAPAAAAGASAPATPGTPSPPSLGFLPGGPVPKGTALVQAGSGRRSLAPQPPEGQRWERDRAACDLLDPGVIERLGGTIEALLNQQGTPWPVGDGCIYMGGYGIGPLYPMIDVDEELGLWARAVAFRGTDGGTLVVVSVDGVGWPWARVNTCRACGAREITRRLGEELAIDPAGIWIHATHSHTSPDFMGAWGGVPEWYLQQATAAIEDAVRDAIADLRPAVLETAEVIARQHNRERRSTYRSAEEAHLTVLRALAVNAGGTRFIDDRQRRQPGVVATLAAYAAHPVTRDADSGVAHPDWIGLFEATVDERDGGRTVHAHTGLGNLSPAGGTQMGAALADELPRPGAGNLLQRADLRVAQQVVTHPVSNLPLTLLGLPGFVDREFVLEPSTASSGPSDTAPCISAGLASVRAPVAAARIGDTVALSAGPGELYSNATNVIKERSATAVTFPLSQINDALGYIGQSFEVDRASQFGLGFVADGYLFVDYEDSYAIDLCFGDEVVERSIALLGDLAAR